MSLFKKIFYTQNWIKVIIKSLNSQISEFRLIAQLADE